MSDKFCPLPWVFQAIRNNGDVRVCCQANPSKSKGIYRKSDGTSYNANRDNLDESRNCDLAKEIRLSMLNNVEHEACVRCDVEEASGIDSRRQYETRIWKNTFNLNHATQLTNNDGSIDIEKVPVLYYDLRFGNLCNLKCRMCGPTDSNSWYADYVKVWNETSFNDSHGTVNLIQKSKNRFVAEFDDYNWFENEQFWKNIEKNIPNIQEIHTVGGEPMMIDKHYDLLEKCIEMGYSKNIMVEYNTNLTNIPARAWKLWPHFKRIQFGVSVDAAESLNDYIRYPSKWKKISENLHKLDNTPGNYRIWLSITVQIYNVAYLPETIKWILKQDFKTIGKNLEKPLFNPHPLYNPRFLNTKILPKEAKDWIRVKYDDFYIWVDDYLEKSNMPDEWKNSYKTYIKKTLESYYDIMVKEDWSDSLQTFWNYTTKLDEIRNEKLSDVAPELYEIIKKYVK